MAQKYTVNWDFYPSHLQNMMNEMKKSDELTDVTLVCDDKIQIKAHKIVLSACSSIFKSIINSLPPQQCSVIYLHGIQHTDVESLLDYMYLGSITINHDRMNKFLNIANSFEIKEFESFDDLGTNDTKESFKSNHEDNLQNEIEDYEFEEKVFEKSENKNIENNDATEENKTMNVDDMETKATEDLGIKETFNTNPL